eukprot:197845-Rhodomonas_salina.1
MPCFCEQYNGSNNGGQRSYKGGGLKKRPGQVKRRPGRGKKEGTGGGAEEPGDAPLPGAVRCAPVPSGTAPILPGPAQNVQQYRTARSLHAIQFDLAGIRVELADIRASLADTLAQTTDILDSLAAMSSPRAAAAPGHFHHGRYRP